MLSCEGRDGRHDLGAKVIRCNIDFEWKDCYDLRIKSGSGSGETGGREATAVSR